MDQTKTSGLGNLMVLKEAAPPQKAVNTLLLAGQPNDCLLIEQVITGCFPGKKILQVSGSNELMELLSFYMPDLLFLDLNLPCRKSEICLKAVRENPAYDKMPVVAYSTARRKATHQAAYGLGANSFFTFTKDPADLEKILRGLLDKDWEQSIGERSFRKVVL
jgi:CheY-like chemotaxis protein